MSEHFTIRTRYTSQSSRADDGGARPRGLFVEHQPRRPPEDDAPLPLNVSAERGSLSGVADV
jgi:hypothetical protein